MSTKLLTPAGVSGMACRLLQQNTGTLQGRVHQTTSTQYVTTVQATAHHIDCLGCLVACGSSHAEPRCHTLH
jgi:hypothetical protein